MMNWRRYTLLTMLVFALIAAVGAGQYLRSDQIDTDKAAALRRMRNMPAAKPTTTKSPIHFQPPPELAIGQRHGPFTHGTSVIPIMNSELTDTYHGNGWRGSGRGHPNGFLAMNTPSFTVPAGAPDAALWASATALAAYLPTASHVGGAFAEGSLVGTQSVYRQVNRVQENLDPPTGFWSDLGGVGSAGFSKGTAGPGGYREPFITEAAFYNNVGVNIKRQSYSFSFGYDHTNDFVLVRYALTNTGDVDTDLDGAYEDTGVTVKNLLMTRLYDFDISTHLSPLRQPYIGVDANDDKVPGGFFTEVVHAPPDDLPGSGRHNQPPYGPRVYSGIVSMFDGDNPALTGVDSYIWSPFSRRFNPLHVGEAALLVLEGNGAGTLGDLDAPIKRTVWGGPAIGLFQGHQWPTSEPWGPGSLVAYYQYALSPYLTSYPGDPAVAGGPPQPIDLNPNPDFFVSGAPFDQDTDISAWVPKLEVGPLTRAFGDPRRPGTFSGVTSAPFTNPPGKYNHITLFDLDGPFQPVVPDPYKGGDRKEIASEVTDNREMISWGPFDLGVGESMTVWQVDLAGAGMDGIYDVYLRAQDVWMQRKYNMANDTYYWDGSNDRTIPVYQADGAYVTDPGTGRVLTQTVNPGRSPDSGALFFPPPAPTLSVIETLNGTVALAWAHNAETAIDPGTGAVDFDRYRVYRSSGFVDQFPTVTTPHPSGYNQTIIPPNMGLRPGGSPVTDVSDPLASAVRTSHPYARFIHEGSPVNADFNIGGVFDFITPEIPSTFAASPWATTAFEGPYVQIAEFKPEGTSSLPNLFDPPATVTAPNPFMDRLRLPGFTEDILTFIPSSRRIVDKNALKGSTEAVALTFPATTYDGESGGTLRGIEVDARLAGRQGYLFEDRSPLIGFNYYYYVASVDHERAMHRDFDSFLQNPTGSSQTVISREIEGLESFYTMNANGTDGLWHGQFPFRGRTTGPQVPGQAVIPVIAPRNEVTPQGPAFLDLVTVAPNPFDFQAEWDRLLNAEQSVRFFNLPVPCRITIFDVSGLQVDRFNVPIGETLTEWDLTNQNGAPVASGLYIILIKAELGGRAYTKMLKLYVRK